MEETTETDEDLLENRLKEAKVYSSMGLYAEARDVYARILEDFPDIPAHSRERIQDQIDQIDVELSEPDGEDFEGGLTSEALSFIREELTEGEDPEDTLRRASAFEETGQFGEALEEYKRLLKSEYPADRVLGNLLECTLRLFGPNDAPDQVEKLSSEVSLGKRERARLKFKLGVEMENRQLLDSAVQLYRAARSIIPEDINMRSALDAKIAGLSTGSRYAYLLNQGWISEEDLTEAEKEAKKGDSSIDSVLLDAFGIGKEDLGRSLSVFYGLPFKAFDPNTAPPFDLLPRLDRATLSLDGWVPLASYTSEADVLMEFPDDQAKIRRIQESLQTDSINLFVGIREDIAATIDQFFRAADLAGKPVKPEKGAAQDKARKTRKERRYTPSIPDFVYVEFHLKGEKGTGTDHRLDVLNASVHGIGLLLRKDEREIAELVKPGSIIPDMTFYAPWTLIQADATVRHVTPITKGRHKGHYLLGVESREIIESSRMPD